CRWYKLRSKPGKKEKERGEIEVDIQFMRSNMTASMFDLSMKDKSRSPFGKLKDKLKGKRSSGLSDTSSAIVPSTTHSPADSEDEAFEKKEKENKKSKFKALFSKPGLQKTSLSQSMSVLPTQQSLTPRVRLHPSDFQSQWDDEESDASPTSETFGNALEEKSSLSPVFKSRKTATLDSRQPNQAATGHTKREGLSLFGGLRSKNDPVSKSSLCINGSHVYMEESTTKDNTPASSPSPHNFRRKQLFASEENLSSRSAKIPEEPERAAPNPAFSGSTSLETFKSLSLPSYKLLSSEEYLESSVPPPPPPAVEVIRETKKTDQKKSALFSLVTGKKEAAKSSDAENIPDRALQEKENEAPEEKSEHETKGFEPVDLNQGDPPGDNQHSEALLANKQPLNPFEEERKPDKVKTKAVKPRLGVPSEEETKATLPSLTPHSLPAFLSVPHLGSDNNPFISKTGQNFPVSGSENMNSPPASLASPPAAEPSRSNNPFASAALEAGDVAHLLSSPPLAASSPKTILCVQVSGSSKNPFASKSGEESSWDQGPGRSDAEASQSLSPTLSPSLPSHCHFHEKNPFVSKLGWEADAPGLAGSSPLCLPGEEESSSAEEKLKQSDCGASGNISALAVAGDAKAVSQPLSPALAPKKQQLYSPHPQVETSQRSRELGKRRSVSFLLGGPEGDLGEQGAELSPESELAEKISAEKGQEEPSPTLEPWAAPLDRNDSFSQVGSDGPTSGARAPSPGEAAGGRAGREELVTPKPAPRHSLALKKCPPASQAAEQRADGVKPAPGLHVGRASDTHGCLPLVKSATPSVTLRGDRHLETEGFEDFFDSLPNLKSALPGPGERGQRLASLPVIPEGGSDEESPCVAVGEENIPETGKQALGITPWHEELTGPSAAAQVGPAARGRGSAPGALKPSSAEVLPAREEAPGAREQGAESGSGVMSHCRESDTHLEEEELQRGTGVEESTEHSFFETSLSSFSLSSPSQPYSSSPSLPSDTPSRRAESPKKPPAEGSADKAGNCGKKKLLRAWVSPSETFPNQGQQGGEALSPQHRLHPVKPMNSTANTLPSKNLNVLSTMNEKLLEMKVKKYDPSDPAYAYAQLTHDELIQLVLKQKDAITKKDLQVRELEDYIDNLLVRVMEETPNILRVSMSGNKKAGKM
ncbi:RFIP1 protein, partial [Turnix velox]|nr:RFIP1 protein [Turnix velox]